MARSLESHRFNINPESADLMGRYTELVNKIRKVAPEEMMGISFFGSRTVALEQRNPDAELSPDLDTCLYYDGSKLDPVTKEETVDKLKFLFEEVMYKEGLEVTRDNSIIMVDASEQQTEKELALFKSNVVEATDNFTRNFNIREYKNIGQSNFRLVSRFFMGVGDRLYLNREYILDLLANDKEHGEGYFQILMEFLQFCERTIKTKKRPEGLPEYKNYPKTISEARNYFIIRAPKITKQK